MTSPHKVYLLKSGVDVCLEVCVLKEDLNEPLLVSLLEKILESIEFNYYKFIDLDCEPNEKYRFSEGGRYLFLGSRAWDAHPLSQTCHLELNALKPTGDGFVALSHSLSELSQNPLFKRALWQVIKQIQVQIKDRVKDW